MKTSFPSRWAQAAGAVLLTALMMASASPASAQSTRTLTIEDGAVALDGERLPEDALPDSLDLSGVQAYYRFNAGATPIIELDGRLFTVEGDRLVEVDPAEVADERAPSVSMFFSGSPGLAAPGAWQSRSSAVTGLGPQALVPGTFGAQPSLTPSPRSPGTSWLMRPQTETQRYLSDMQRENRQLHERLMREREMEYESIVLAAQIRRLPEDAPERERLTEELRRKLEDIFALKEENRRRETEQLEKELEKLRDQLRNREENRAAIVEHRLNELIGRGQELDW